MVVLFRLPNILNIGNYPSLLNLSFSFFSSSLTLVSHQVLLIPTLPFILFILPAFASVQAFIIGHPTDLWLAAHFIFQHPFKSYFLYNICIAGPAVGIVDIQVIKLTLRKFIVTGEKIIQAVSHMTAKYVL